MTADREFKGFQKVKPPLIQWSFSQVYHPKEELERMQVFMDNMKFIEEYNAREDTTMTLGTNEFSDLVRDIRMF